jgi:hypothetical protein
VPVSLNLVGDSPEHEGQNGPDDDHGHDEYFKTL